MQTIYPEEGVKIALFDRRDCVLPNGGLYLSFDSEGKEKSLLIEGRGAGHFLSVLTLLIEYDASPLELRADLV